MSLRTYVSVYRMRKISSLIGSLVFNYILKIIIYALGVHFQYFCQTSVTLDLLKLTNAFYEIVKEHFLNHLKLPKSYCPTRTSHKHGALI